MENKDITNLKATALNKRFFDAKKENIVGYIIPNSFDIGYSETYGTDFMTFKFKHYVTQEVETVVMDGGMFGALKLAKLLKGDRKTENKGELTADGLEWAQGIDSMLIGIIYTGAVELNGNEVNQYDVVSYQN